MSSRRSMWMVLGGVLLLAGGAPAGAQQTVTLTSPTSPTTVMEGDDFFTNVTNERLDFDMRRDFMWEEQFNEPTIGVPGGVWTGAFESPGGYVFPLFAGFPDPNGLANVGRVGARFPIDTSKYKYLSVRRRVSSRTNHAVYVNQAVGFPTLSGLVCTEVDGYFTPAGAVPFANSAWTLDVFDFRIPNPNPTRCAAAFSDSSKWTGQIRALRLDPSISGAAGTIAEFDWVRVVDPTSAPQTTINWTTSGIVDADHQVNVYVDNNNGGFDGAFIGRVAMSTGTFSFPSAALPPGVHYFYVQVRDNQGTTDLPIATSGYSAAYTVNGRSSVTVDDPSMTTGPDYATEVVGNPWDFSDSADVVNLGFVQTLKRFTNPSFGGGLFTATADGPAPPALESDVQVWMNVSASRPILTPRYRYLTLRMSIDPANYTNISDKVMKGHVFRSIFWNTGLQADGSDLRAEQVYEGLNSYTYDLNTPGIVDPNDTFPAQTGWRGNTTIRNFRIDPGEFPFQTNFSLDDVKIRARPEPTSANQFTVKVTTSDPEEDPATIQLFRDTDNTGFDGTLLTTLNNRFPGPHTFAFSTASFFPQDLWIYAVVTDSAGNVTRQYGDAPLHVGPQIWQPFFAVDPLETPYVGDFDGDGRTDIITFTRQNPLAFGDVYVSLSTGSAFGPPTKWHDFFAIDTSEQVVIGDYDGDGKDDIGTWLSTTTRQVYVAKSLGTGMAPAEVWVGSIGFDPSDVLMAGDANGDGRDDLILFARNLGRVYVALSTGTSFGAPTIWHNFFAVSTFERPRVGDLNGDGRADIITFATDSPTAFGDVYVATSDGTRFVDLNGFPNNSSKWHDFFAIRPSEEVRIGDFNNDGRDDFFTFLPAPFGQCYTAPSQGTQMGGNVLWMNEDLVYLDTDKPFVGDVNGDGKADIILFNQVPGVVKVVLTP